MNWWQTFFDDQYAHRHLSESKPEEVAFLMDRLEMPAGSRVLDQCCGYGRISRALAERGLHPVGVDCVPSYIETASRLCPSGSFVCADACEYVAQPTCQGGFNAYSSFAYSADDGHSLAMLERACESLQPGARFVLDTINFALVLSRFQPQMEQSFEDGTRLQRRSEFNWTEGMLEQHWTYHFPDGRVTEKEGRTRILLPREVGQLLTQAGFELLQLFGDTQGGPYARESLRLIWLARRP